MYQIDNIATFSIQILLGLSLISIIFMIMMGRKNLDYQQISRSDIINIIIKWMERGKFQEQDVFDYSYQNFYGVDEEFLRAIIKDLLNNNNIPNNGYIKKEIDKDEVFYILKYSTQSKS